MTRIFDVKDKEDMADLWDTLPDDATKINRLGKGLDTVRITFSEGIELYTYLFKIDWHDETEIVKPILEATKDDIGKICEFWDNQTERTEYKQIGVLTKIKDHIEGLEFKYQLADSVNFEHCRRLTKEEVEKFI